MRNYAQAFKEVFNAGYINESAIEKHVEQQTAIDRLLPDSASFFLVMEVPTNKYHFLGRQQENVSGYSNDVFLEKGIDMFFERLHPDDAHILIDKVYPALTETVLTLPDDDLRKFQMQYNYRFKRKNGVYIDLLEQLYVLEVDESRVPALVLSNIIILNNTERLPVRLTFKLIRDSGFSETIYTRSYPTGSDQIESITKRELDVLRSLALGNSSREIAEEFFISKHTVDTHRRNLLRKLDCKSVVELAKIAFSNGLL